MSMKRTCLLLAFLICTIFVAGNVSAQNITLADMVKYMEYDIDQFERAVRAKGWKFADATPETDEKYGSVVFDYGRSLYDNSKAKGFIIYDYSNFSGFRMLKLQIHREDLYNSIPAQLKAWDTKLIRTYGDDGIFIKVYQGKKYTYFVISMNDRSKGLSGNIYSVHVVTNKYYWLMVDYLFDD